MSINTYSLIKGVITNSIIPLTYLYNLTTLYSPTFRRLG